MIYKEAKGEVPFGVLKYSQVLPRVVSVLVIRT